MTVSAPDSRKLQLKQFRRARWGTRYSISQSVWIPTCQHCLSNAPSKQSSLLKQWGRHVQTHWQKTFLRSTGEMSKSISCRAKTYFLQTKYSLSVPLTLLCSHQGSFEQSDLCMRYYRSNLPVVESLLYLFFTEQNNYWNDLEVPLLSLKQNEFLGNNGPDSHYH